MFQISPKFYIRRNGALMFWRVGALGGSFYWSAKTDAQRNEERAVKTERNIARRDAAKALRREASQWRRLAIAYGAIA